MHSARLEEVHLNLCLTWKDFIFLGWRLERRYLEQASDLLAGEFEGRVGGKDGKILTSAGSSCQ